MTAARGPWGGEVCLRASAQRACQSPRGGRRVAGGACLGEEPRRRVQSGMAAMREGEGVEIVIRKPDLWPVVVHQDVRADCADLPQLHREARRLWDVRGARKDGDECGAGRTLRRSAGQALPIRGVLPPRCRARHPSGRDGQPRADSTWQLRYRVCGTGRAALGASSGKFAAEGGGQWR